MNLEQRRIQIERSTVIGLLVLAIAFLAVAARSTAVHLAWLTADSAPARVLQFIWIVGLLLFGFAFGWLSLLATRLEAKERLAIGDELQVLLSRKSAVSAFVVTFVVAVFIAAIPGSERLPGDAVASIIVGIGAATLALSRFWSNPT